MELVVEKFRSALMGFHRKDVLRYIEQSEAAHRRRESELEEQLARSEEERERLADSLSGLQDENGTMNMEKAKVRASLEESTKTLGRLRGELSQTETKLAVAKQELSRLQAQVGELSPLAQSYQELKDRVATVELDAHRKAQATVDEAQAEAEKLRADTGRWLSGVLDQYSTIRRDLDAALAQLQNLNQMAEQLDRADELARQLREQGGLE